jgi:uncharacterized protein YjbJ (UPF0337 family)
MSTKEKVSGDWNQLKGKVKQHWGQLTDDELSEVEGNIDQLVGLVQQKTGEARQNIEKALTKMSQDAGGTISQATEVAREYANQASEALRGAGDHLREQGMQHYEDAQAMVRRRPAEAVAMAFGTGLVVGLVVGLVASSRKS